MNGAQSEQYINRMSSTVLVFTKVVEGAAAGYVLFHIFRLLSPVIAEFAKGTFDVMRTLELFFKELGLQTLGFDMFSDVLIPGVALPLIAYVGIFILTIAVLILIVIEAIALLALRFAKNGASLVKVIHQIYLLVCIISLLNFVYAVIMFVRQSSDLFKIVVGTDDSMIGWNIALITIAIIILISLLLQLFYHKDIVMAMTTVKYEISTGQQGELRKTHLSGISFLFALPYMFLVLAGIIGVLNNSAGKSEKSQVLIGLIIPIIAMLKYLSVCFCNRNLKRARS